MSLEPMYDAPLEFFQDPEPIWGGGARSKISIYDFFIFFIFLTNFFIFSTYFFIFLTYSHVSCLFSCLPPPNSYFSAPPPPPSGTRLKFFQVPRPIYGESNSFVCLHIFFLFLELRKITPLDLGGSFRIHEYPPPPLITSHSGIPCSV